MTWPAERLSVVEPVLQGCFAARRPAEHWQTLSHNRLFHWSSCRVARSGPTATAPRLTAFGHSKYRENNESAEKSKLTETTRRSGRTDSQETQRSASIIIGSAQRILRHSIERTADFCPHCQLSRHCLSGPHPIPISRSVRSQD